LYLERRVKPRRADDAMRITLVNLSSLVEWRHLLTVVKPEPSSAGIARDSGCGGAGNWGLRADRFFLSTCSS
jgi:hypothetical protein